jgi:hypothetical protein
MTRGRALAFLVAALPIGAAATWSFLLRQDLPEPWPWRRAVGEAPGRWTFAELGDVGAMPHDFAARGLYLLGLQIPGSNVAWLGLAGVVLAGIAVLMLAVFVRGLAGADAAVTPWLALGIGMLACSPAFGANWLLGERLGRFLAPLLLLLGLRALHRDGRWRLRVAIALAAATLAPFCHTNGCAVWLALLPALAAASRVAGSQRRLGLVGLLALLGNTAALASVAGVERFAMGPQGLVARLLATPVPAVRGVCREAGSLWPDVLAATTRDATALGVLSFLAPLLALWLAKRRPERATALAGASGLVLFGLGIAVLHAERYAGAGLSLIELRELRWGGFALPVGVLAVLACALPPRAIAVAAGALAALAVQDWQRGFGDLRTAVARLDRVAACQALPGDLGQELRREHPSLRGADELEALRARGFVAVPPPLAAPESAVRCDGRPPGECAGERDGLIAGHVTGTLLAPAPSLVLLAVTPPGGTEQVVAAAAPRFEDGGRAANWSVALPVAHRADGTVVRAYGYFLRSGRLAPLAGEFVVSGARIVKRGGGS